MRIGGIASGIDTDSIIKNLMQVERLPMNRLTQRKQILEWQRDNFREMNSLLADLRRASLSIASGASLSTKKVSSTDESKLTAIASPSAGNATYNITSGRLATSSYVTSSTSGVIANDRLHSNPNLDWKSTFDETINVTTSGTDFRLSNKNIKEGASLSIKVNNGPNLNVIHDPNAVLGSNDVFVNKETGQMRFGSLIASNSKIEATYEYYNRQTLTATSDGQKEFQLSKSNLSEVKSFTVKNPDGTLGTTYTLITEGEPGEGQFKVGTDGKLTLGGAGLLKGSSFEIEYIAKNVQFSITTFDSNGNEVFSRFTLEGNDTVNSAISKINNSTAGVSAFFDERTQQISVSRKQTGVNNPNGQEMVFEGHFLNNFLNLSSGNYVSGSDAEITVNGITITRQSNNFTIDGVNFTLKNNFTNPITISVTNDNSKIIENIKSFVEKYNEVVGGISDKISEERFRNFQPLTPEQRKDMTEQEVKLWDEKAKSGMLRGDSILRNALSQLRVDISSPVNTGGTFNMLSQIGIATTADFRSPKLEIDEMKLLKALEADPLAVQRLFNQNDDGSKGVGVRLQETIRSTIGRIEAKAGNQFRTNHQFSIGKDLIDVDQRISSFERRLVDIENRYWTRFTAMEKAMNQANAQAMTFMQQMMGPGNF